MASLASSVVVSAAVLAGAGIATAATTDTVVGRGGLSQFAAKVRTRPRETLAPIALLASVLLFNKVVRDLSPEVSRLVGWNVTGTIYALEGAFVATLQSVATPSLTALFSGATKEVESGNETTVVQSVDLVEILDQRCVSATVLDTGRKSVSSDGSASGCGSPTRHRAIRTFTNWHRYDRPPVAHPRVQLQRPRGSDSR
ncbi:hypothetical protein [Haloplanus aerogenes]|uniref:Uncharacterized protein n=1 Tax=Haloplanus aerogenes TaxID=660522 RepID=A0A3M0DAC8_9EURY|nr:hypothetical protein [Haloplanus aerogenes]AZH26047.1 hypothetical protein DU502_12055 [Haloplanus aerogenes]RMB18508.1 hypothetical protein ATH50_1969 [Haloplanus aerogenes]